MKQPDFLVRLGLYTDLLRGIRDDSERLPSEVKPEDRDRYEGRWEGYQIALRLLDGVFPEINRNGNGVGHKGKYPV